MEQLSCSSTLGQHSSLPSAALLAISLSPGFLPITQKYNNQSSSLLYSLLYRYRSHGPSWNFLKKAQTQFLCAIAWNLILQNKTKNALTVSKILWKNMSNRPSANDHAIPSYNSNRRLHKNHFIIKSNFQHFN